MKSNLIAASLLIPAALAGGGEVESIDVEPVWAGHPVGFSLLTRPPHQFAAYYDADRRMSVAQRRLDEKTWTITKLPQRVGWDSHNGVTMAIDRAGHLHLSGNMHCAPLVYFRTEEPLDAASLVRVANMVGPERERRVTYPVFIHRPAGDLVFRYRDGSSGNGDDIYNVYDEKTRVWRRLIDTPLTSGQGKMNAYCSRPALGPDGRFHMTWVWRDTPDCATNHDLSYARSADLVNWETGGGKPLKLPMALGCGAVVDPVPVKGGIINGCQRLGFDSQHRPILTYHKYDAANHTQVYAARIEDGRWVIHQISNWGDYRWDFSGGGSIEFEVRLSAVKAAGDSRLRMPFVNGRGRGTIWLDEATLKPVSAPKPKAPSHRVPKPTLNRTAQPKPPADLSFPGLQRRGAGDLGTSGDPAVLYRLEWQALGPNRDRPRQGPLPPPVMLRLVKFTRS